MDAVIIIVLGVLLAIAVAFARTSPARRRKGDARFSILNEIAEVSDRGGSLRETLDEICDVLVPEIADFCTIDLIDERQGRAGRGQDRPWRGRAGDETTRRPPALAAGGDGTRAMARSSRASSRR